MVGLSQYPTGSARGCAAARLTLPFLSEALESIYDVMKTFLLIYIVIDIKMICVRKTSENRIPSTDPEE
jgi:hypothetical protein